MEYKLQLRALVKLLWVVGFASLYALGGIEYKFLRRFIAPIWLCSGMFVFSRDWRVFLQAPLLMLTLSLGYGADLLWIKIGRRLLFGFANGFTAIVHGVNFCFRKSTRRDFRSFWILFRLHLILCCLVVVILGSQNPVIARTEELLIGLIIGLLPMYMIKEKE